MERIIQKNAILTTPKEDKMLKTVFILQFKFGVHSFDTNPNILH